MRNQPRVLVAALLALSLVLAACGDDGGSSAGETTSERFVALDGSPRYPDDAGVVTDIDSGFANLTIDGESEYKIHPDVQSFASIDGSTQPLRSRLGQYVHVGLQGDTVVWIAGIGSVVRVADQPETVLYLANISSTEDGGATLILRDGTVFEVEGTFRDITEAQGVEAVLRIGVTSDLVTSIDVAE